jgi:hypothetical protein
MMMGTILLGNIGSAQETSAFKKIFASAAAFVALREPILLTPQAI